MKGEAVIWDRLRASQIEETKRRKLANAAPDLAEALEALLAVEDGDLFGEQFRVALNLAKGQARAALRKAKGEA